MATTTSLVVKIPYQYCDKCTDALSRWCDPIIPHSEGWSSPDDADNVTKQKYQLTSDAWRVPVWTWRVSDLKHSARKCRCCRFLVRTLEASSWMKHNRNDFIQLKSHLVGSQHRDPYDRQCEDNQYEWNHNSKKPLEYERYHRPRLQVFRRTSNPTDDEERDYGTKKSWTERQMARLIRHFDQDYVASDFTFILPLAAKGSVIDENFGHQDIFKGRTIGTKLDFSLVQKWFEECSSAHVNKPKDLRGADLWDPLDEKEDCRPVSNPLIPNFRLIDVHKRCTILAAREYSYAALSYVWGKARRLLLRGENVSKLSTPGSLLDDNPELPRTFKDAFFVAAKLGIKYLWIDALCVLQDNEKQLVEHMNAMDSIYSSAILTIVSDTASADSGIAGVSISRNPPQATFQYGNTSYISTKRTFGKALSISAWESRAWCLQEKVFSKRLLIFTESQAFYHCRCSTLFEDTVMESKEKRVGRVKISERVDATCKRSKSPGLTAYEAHTNFFGRNFWSLVEIYTQRQLSFEKDTIRAFSGILKSIEEDEGPAIWGIPEYRFGRGLVWSLDPPKLSLRRKEFPSWSWAGWKGNAGAKLKFHDFVKMTAEDIWKVNWHYYRWDKESREYILTPVEDVVRDYRGKIIRRRDDPESGAKFSMDSMEDTTKDDPAAHPHQPEPANPTSRLVTLPSPKVTLEATSIAPDQKEESSSSIPDAQASLSAGSPSDVHVKSAQKLGTAVSASPSPKPLPAPLSYFPANARTASWETQQNAIRERKSDDHSWCLSSHPGDPDYVARREMPPLIHDACTMPPLEHVIRAYTSVARLVIDEEPDRDLFKHHSSYYRKKNFHAIRVPGTGEQLGHVELDHAWKGKGKEHDFIFVARGYWIPSDSFRGHHPEILHLMLVQGNGEIKTKVQMVGPIDIANWRLANPVWKCVSLA